MKTCILSCFSLNYQFLPRSYSNLWAVKWRISVPLSSMFGYVLNFFILSEQKYRFNQNIISRLCILISLFLSHLHLVLRFWNQVLTWASVIFSVLARAARSALARYFCLWKRFSNSQICTREKDVRGFFLFGGVRFWYGWPMRRATVNGVRAAVVCKRKPRWDMRGHEESVPQPIVLFQSNCTRFIEKDKQYLKDLRSTLILLT